MARHDSALRYAVQSRKGNFFFENFLRNFQVTRVLERYQEFLEKTNETIKSDPNHSSSLKDIIQNKTIINGSCYLGSEACVRLREDTLEYKEDVSGIAPWEEMRNSLDW